MANKQANNSYEEIRKQRLEDNLKRFQDLGILKISKSLSEVANLKKKVARDHVKAKSKPTLDTLELRRSSRERNLVPSYREVSEELHHFYRRKSSCRVSEVRSASYEERVYAMKTAENLQSNLKSGHPSFVKPMVRSHVSSCFWLGLPRKFCTDYLPPDKFEMVLEDENGVEYGAIYIGEKTGLSGGWKCFAMDHKLDDGDALVFELAEPMRFKVYIIKASGHTEQGKGEKPIKLEANRSGKSKMTYEVNDQELKLEIKPKKHDQRTANHTGKSKKTHKICEKGNGPASQELQSEIQSIKRAERAAKRSKQY